MERSTREARELGDKAGDIYNQVCKVAERLSKLGNSLQAANNHFNSTVTALTGRQGLHGKVERFADKASHQCIPLLISDEARVSRRPILTRGYCCDN